MALGPKAIDLTDQRFERLVAREYERRGKTLWWRCDCDCGASVWVRSQDLRRKSTRSCGCLQEETRRLTLIKHGHTANGNYTAEWKTWNGIVGRTSSGNANDANYRKYGARGVRMCDGWRLDFEKFFRDLGPKPGPNFSVDRIDNARGYECGSCDDCKARGATPNCEWRTYRDQALNRRTTRWITYQGRTMCMKDWANELGVHPALILRRLQRGWDVERALTEPAGEQHLPPPEPTRLTFNGETLTLTEWSERLGVALGTLQARVKRGWSTERVLTAPSRFRRRGPKAA